MYIDRFWLVIALKIRKKKLRHSEPTKFGSGLPYYLAAQMSFMGSHYGSAAAFRFRLGLLKLRLPGGSRSKNVYVASCTSSFRLSAK